MTQSKASEPVLATEADYTVNGTRIYAQSGGEWMLVDDQGTVSYIVDRTVTRADQLHDTIIQRDEMASAFAHQQPRAEVPSGR
jgi:hypothetical protein